MTPINQLLQAVEAQKSVGPAHQWLVAAMGIMVELMLAALALFVWIYAEHGMVRGIAYNAMLPELNAFDDYTVTNIKTGNYALCRNVSISSALISPSSKARPLIAAGTPRWRSCARSSI